MVNSKKQKGFTLIEVLIYSAVFVIAGGVMLGVFTVIIKLEANQTVNVEMANQIEFVMQQMKRLITTSSTIDLPDDKTITLTMPDATVTTIKIEDKKITVDGTPITTDKVEIIEVDSSFTGHPEPLPGSGSDAVSIKLKVSAKGFGGVDIVRTIQTTIARGI